jgi:hypothetical protein
MKTIAYMTGILMALMITGALADDKKSEVPATMRNAKTETVNEDSLTAAWREKLAKSLFPEEPPDRIVGRRFVFSGPLVGFVKSDNPLQTFNPFAVSNADRYPDNYRPDAYLPPLRGFALFRLEF